MIEGKTKKSKALIIALVIVILLAIGLFFLFKNRENILETKNISNSNNKIFQSLFGTSKSKNVKVIDTLNSGKNTTQITAQAGENIKKGDLLYKSGVDKNGNPIVKKIKKIKSSNSNGGLNYDYDYDIYGISLEDINDGYEGQILIPDLNINPNFWDDLKGSINEITNNVGDWINNIINPNENNNNDVDENYNCTYNGQTIPCDQVPPENPDSYKCALNGQTIPCDQLNIVPQVSVKATPSSINSGESSTITWTSNNATSCKRADLPDGSNNVATSDQVGFSTGPITEDKSYTITCTSANGSTNGGVAFVYINNIDHNNSIYPIVIVSANPTNIYSGESSTITWTSINATSCKRADLPDGTNSVATSDQVGFSTGPITENKSYTITCTAANGSTMDGTAYINMNELPQCGDGINNDEDNLIDNDDPGCHTDYNSSNENSYAANRYESSVEYIPECRDGIDNEIYNADGTIISGVVGDGADSADPDCYEDGVYNEDISFETGIIPEPSSLNECSDGVDNDGNNDIDSLDPDCHSDGNVYNSNSYLEDHDSESVAVTQVPECKDGIDNDGNNDIDSLDPDCHYGGLLTAEYLPENAYESVAQEYNDNSTIDNNEEKNLCLGIEQNPLTFTDDEKARLNELLRDFYLISSSLRTTTDITTIYNTIDQQKDFINQVGQLTKQCYLQTADSSDFYDFCKRNPSLCDADYYEEYMSGYNTKYSNNLTRRNGNPWYSKSKSGTFPYTSGDQGYTDVNWIQKDQPEVGIENNQTSCEVISGYYYGNVSKDVWKSDSKSFLFIDLGTKNTKIADSGDSCTIFNGTVAGINFNQNYADCNAQQKQLWSASNSYLPYHDEILKAGCQWKDGVNINETEKLLKIW